MARPIEGIPTLTGRAARWLVNYLKNATPSPEKAERARRDREAVRRYIRPLRPMVDHAEADFLEWYGGVLVERAAGAGEVSMDDDHELLRSAFVAGWRARGGVP